MVTCDCPACRAAERTATRWIETFIHESHTNASVQDALAHADGFCPAHGRQVLSADGAQRVLPTPFAYVTGLLARPPRRREPGVCPVCEAVSRTVTATVGVTVDALGSPEVARGYREAGFCFGHARLALGAIAPDAARTIIEALSRRAQEGLECGGLGWFTGMDVDATLRQYWRKQNTRDPSRITRAESTLQWLYSLLESDACPACHAAGTAEAQYLAWLGRQFAEDARTLAGDVVWVCPRHVSDLLVLQPSSAGELASFVAGRVLHGCATGLASLDALPGDGVSARLRAANAERVARGRVGGGHGPGLTPAALLLLPRRHLVRRAAGAATADHGCGVCRVGREATRRLLDLLLRALDVAAVADRYDRSHGLCLHHVRSLPASPHRARIERVLHTRLRLLEWELEEASRRASWPARHETPGDEMTAWLRAAAALDGRTFLGGRPRPDRSVGGRRAAPGATPSSPHGHLDPASPVPEHPQRLPRVPG